MGDTRTAAPPKTAAAAETKQWYAVYEKETIKLVSTGTVLPEKLSDQYAVVELPEPVDFAAQEWDAAGKCMVARVPAPKPFTAHRVLDRLTRADAATLLEAFGLAKSRARELTED